VARKKPREELSSAAGAAAARLSKRLVTIRTDIDLPPLRCAPAALLPPLRSQGSGKPGTGGHDNAGDASKVIWANLSY